MSYEVAINKAWADLDKLQPDKDLSIRFLTDNYSIDFSARKLMSLSCNVPAKDFVAILILHYLAERLKGLPELTGEWISFKELAGGEFYYPAFRKRAIEPILSKYGSNPQNLLSVLDKGMAKKNNQADAAVVIDVFENVPVLVEIWKGDEEFGPEANMLFDRSIAEIFCTEDIAVLVGFVAKHI